MIIKNCDQESSGKSPEILNRNYLKNGILHFLYGTKVVALFGNRIFPFPISIKAAREGPNYLTLLLINLFTLFLLTGRQLHAHAQIIRKLKLNKSC